MKKLTSLVLLPVILLTLISCDPQGNTKNSDGRLSIYLMDADSDIIDAVSSFNSSHKDITIDVKTYSFGHYEQYSQELGGELVSGEGPDLVVVKPDTLPELSKYMDSSVFLDLNTLIKKDKQFKLGDYNEKIMDYGVYKDKIYFLPISYSIESLYSTKDILDNNGIRSDEPEHTLKQFRDMAGKYMKDHEGKDTRFASGLTFRMLLQNGVESFINMENKTTRFDSPEFIGLLNTYKEINQSICTEDQYNKYIMASSDESGMLKNGNVDFINGKLNGPIYMAAFNYSGFDKEIDPVIWPLPTQDGESRTVAVSYKIAAINSQCKNLKAAFEFIKYLLSKEQQIKKMTSIPVNLEAYRQQKDDILKNADNIMPRSKSLKSDAAVKKLFARLDEMIAAIARCDFVDAALQHIIDKELSSFLSGKSTAETTAKTIQEKADSYFTGKLTPPLKMAESIEAKATEAIEVKDTYPIKLRIDFPPYSDFITNAIPEFKKKYPNVIVEQNGHALESMDKLVTELMAGAGGDIIVFQHRNFNSLEKAVSSELFADMNQFMSKDKEFDTSVFYKEAFDAGVRGDKRYFIPLEYHVNGFYTTKSMLKKNNIVIDESNWTLDALRDIVNDFSNKNKDTKKYFFDSLFGLGSMVNSSGLSLVDYANKKSYFDSQEFIELLKMYKDFVPVISPDYTGSFESLKNEEIIFMFTRLKTPEMYLSDNSECKKNMNEDIELLPFPSYSGKCTYMDFALSNHVAINAKSSNKEAAYEFIKIILSRDLQRYYKPGGWFSGGLYIPVNTEAFKADLDFYTGKKERDRYVKSFTNRSFLPEIVAQKYSDIVLNAKKPVILDGGIRKIIGVETRDYIAGKRTAERTAKAINEKVTLFLNE